MIVNYVEAVITLTAALLFSVAAWINMSNIVKFRRPSLTRWSTCMFIMNTFMAILLAVYAAFIMQGGFGK